MLRKTCSLIFALMLVVAANAQTNQTTQTKQTNQTTQTKQANQVKASDLKNLEKEAARIDADAGKAAGPDKPFEILSKELGIPAEMLKTQKQSTSFGFGQLFIANALAKATGKTFDQISLEFQQGKGWGAIAGENGVKLGPIVSQMRNTNKAMERERNSEPKGQRGQPVQPDRGKGRGTGRGNSF